MHGYSCLPSDIVATGGNWIHDLHYQKSKIWAKKVSPFIRKKPLDCYRHRGSLLDEDMIIHQAGVLLHFHFLCWKVYYPLCEHDLMSVEVSESFSLSLIGSESWSKCVSLFIPARIKGV